jgi:hypothetical protein
MAFTRENSIPPILPINWADWEGDEHVFDMSEAMEGIYFRIIRELWKHDTFEFNHNRLADRIRADRRNVKKFMEKWGHLFRCSKCAGVPLVVRSECAPSVSLVCSHCASSVLRVCSCHAPTVLHEKLKNYKNDVNSGLSLGTTERNRTETNPTTNERTHVRKSVSESVQKPQQQPTTTPAESPSQAVRRSVSSELDSSVPSESSTPAKTELANIREWNTPAFGLSAERLRNCLIYVLDHNDYYKEHPPTLASMTREKFVQKINEETPLGWEPPKVKTFTKGHPDCRTCHGCGFKSVWSNSGCGHRIECPDCEKHEEDREHNWIVDGDIVPPGLYVRPTPPVVNAPAEEAFPAQPPVAEDTGVPEEGDSEDSEEVPVTTPKPNSMNNECPQCGDVPELCECSKRLLLGRDNYTPTEEIQFLVDDKATTNFNIEDEDDELA